MNYYYTYVLQSESDSKYYTGYTNNIERRFEDHNNGKVESTKNRRPFKLIYFKHVCRKRMRRIEKNI